MGTPMAPTVANLFMGWLESALLQQSPVNIDPVTWKRFIDDILMLWRGSKEELDTFTDFINSVHPTIKFVVNSSTTRIPFLDVLLTLKEGFIHTEIYTKTTDAHTYLPFNSCHPRHCVNNIPYSQFLRLRRLCSDTETFRSHSHDMAQHFSRRGYPEEAINRAQQKALNTPRSETLQYKNQKTTDRVPAILTHNPLNPPLGRWLRDSQPLLHTSKRMKKAAPDVPLVGYRKCRSLRDMFMPSSLPAPPSDLEPGCRRCTKKCITCRLHLVETTRFHSAQTSEEFTIRDAVSCDASNIIYLLFCSCCPYSQYVGQTKNSLKIRLALHRSHIAKNTGTLVTNHFNTNAHSVDNLRCTVIEKVHTNDLQHRLRREKFWMEKLRTLAPYGLNSLDS